MDRKIWTLLAVSLAEGRRLQPVELQKSLFLLGKKMDKELGEGFYTFKPYDYGPFSRAIYDDADALAREGYIQIRQAGHPWREYTITDDGQEYLEESLPEVPPKAKDFLAKTVAWTQSMPFQKLIRAIYEHFPKYAENSVFKD